MIDRIHALFSSLDQSATGTPPKPDADKHLASAVLLVEAACVDGSFNDREYRAIAEILATRFSLSKEEVATLLAKAKELQSSANHLVRFTRTIKDTVPLDERAEMLEILWEIVYADGVAHEYESNLLRRVAGLLYVPDRDSGAARKRVLARLGIQDTNPA